MTPAKEFEVDVVHTGTKVDRTFGPAIVRAEIPRITKAKAVTAEKVAVEEDENIYRIPARGGGGGTPFEIKLWDKTNRKFHRIKRLEIWIERGKAMRAVKVTFDNGFEQIAGTIEKDHRVLELHCEEEELITTTVIYVSKWKRKGRTNGIDIRTDWNQRLHHQAFDKAMAPLIPDAPIPYTDDTKGALIGVYGASGVDIDRLGFILELPADDEYIFEDVNYDLSERNIVGEKPISLKKEEVENPTDATVMQRISFSHTHSDTKSWGHSIGLKAGVKTSIKTGVPFIAEGKVELSFEASYSYNWGHSLAETITDTWDATLTAPPYSRLRAVASVTEATINVPFTAKLRKKKSDGSEEIVDQVSGVYEGVSVSKFKVKVEDLLSS